MTSRPLPVVDVSRPSADRGADDVREHLDGDRCIFCGVIVGEDETNIPADKFGHLVHRPICKAHHEHPESWNYAVHEGDLADRMTFCPTCGDVMYDDTFRDECSTCDPIEYPSKEKLYG